MIGRTATQHSKLVESVAQKHAATKKWADLLKKWPEIPAHKIETMAMMVENQFNHMSNKGSNSGSVLLEDATTTANIADFTKFALPMIRKSYPKMIADQLVGVQPMNQPMSMIFYIRYRYALTKGQTQAGTQIMRQNTNQNFARNNGWALDPYYSSTMVKGETATIGAGLNTVTATLQHRPVLAGTVMVEVFATEADASPSCNEPSPCLRVTYDHNGVVDSVTVGTCATFTAAIVVNTLTSTFDHATGNVTVNLSGGTFPSGSVARVNYEYDLENNPFQPEITMSIDKDSVTAQTRKLKTSWSIEAAQDLKASHNLDAEQVLTDLLADEMVGEIDREIINDLLIAAAVRADHNFATAAGASVNFTDRNLALIYKMLEVANVIHRTTLRSPANWAVTSSDISSKVEQLNDFRASDALVAGETYNAGIINSGSLSNKLKLFKDPLFPSCKILMGFKGRDYDAGYIYAPYVPLLATNVIPDSNSYSPSKGIMTRYGKKLIEDGSLNYGVINVSNL